MRAGACLLRLLARLQRAADPGGVLGAGAMPLLRAEELLLGAAGATGLDVEVGRLAHSRHDTVLCSFAG